MSTYTNNAQQRLMVIVEALAGHEENGIALTTLSKETGHPANQIFRDLKNLEEYGWARQIGTSWALAPRAVAPAVRVRKNLDDLMGKVNQINKEYLGGE